MIQLLQRDQQLHITISTVTHWRTCYNSTYWEW